MDFVLTGNWGVQLSAVELKRQIQNVAGNSASAGAQVQTRIFWRIHLLPRALRNVTFTFGEVRLPKSFWTEFHFKSCVICIFCHFDILRGIRKNFFFFPELEQKTDGLTKNENATPWRRKYFDPESEFLIWSKSSIQFVFYIRKYRS